MFVVATTGLGIIKRTRDRSEAEAVYRQCRDEAAAGRGDFAFEGILLLEGDRVVRESLGTYPHVEYAAGY